MRAIPFAALAVLALLGGCNADTDGDGLTDAEEKDLGLDPDVADSDDDALPDGDEVSLGTDPLNADSDGDSLLDGEEVSAGTDPLAVDSDGDGYRDPDELTEGTDPTNADSVIYQGGWPYNPDKDSMEDPGWDGRAKEGNMVPRFQTYDLYGDEFDLYDMAMTGKPVMIDISGEWCVWCKEMAKFMAGEESEFDAYVDSYYPYMPVVRDALAAGDIYWVEILDANQDYGVIAQEDLEQWERKYPVPNCPVIADEEMLWADWTSIVGYPTLMAVDETMTIIGFDKQDYNGALEAIGSLFE